MNRNPLVVVTTLAIGGSAAGVSWSGAMRCPKCRADMEQVEYEGVEIDRCKYCKGIWFDAGESELSRTKEAAVAIDAGEFSDLSQHTISDFFKRLSTPERK